MKCEHVLFNITKHGCCPTCGETNTDKILDERFIVGLSMETARLLKLVQRLQAENDRLRQEVDAALAVTRRLCPVVTNTKAIVMPKNIEGLFPHATCQTPDECRREGVCIDGWNCNA